jgi:hypothetical protein
VDHCFTVSCWNQTWDNILVHDNLWYVAHAVPETNMGDDGLQGKNWSGVSVYNNTIIGYGVSNYQGTQHQDGMQPLGGDHIKVYNNYFQDICNYPVYGDAVYGGFQGFYVFNNIVALVTAGVRASPAPQGVAIGSEMNNAPFSDIVVANNIVADYGSHTAIALGAGGSGTIQYGSNLRVQNNIILNNNSTNPIHPDPNVTISNNVLSTGAGMFVSYIPNKANTADFHLVSPAPTLIGAGVNLTVNSDISNITLDRDGVQRPASGNWDIGPYQYSATPQAPQAPQAPQNLRILGSTTP